MPKAAGGMSVGCCLTLPGAVLSDRILKGIALSRSSSTFTSMRAICLAWLPLPTPR